MEAGSAFPRRRVSPISHRCRICGRPRCARSLRVGLHICSSATTTSAPAIFEIEPLIGAFGCYIKSRDGGSTHWHLRMALQPLARPVLSREVPPIEDARLLRTAFLYGRDQ